MPKQLNTWAGQNILGWVSQNTICVWAVACAAHRFPGGGACSDRARQVSQEGACHACRHFEVLGAPARSCSWGRRGSRFGCQSNSNQTPSQHTSWCQQNHALIYKLLFSWLANAQNNRILLNKPDSHEILRNSQKIRIYYKIIRNM